MSEIISTFKPLKGGWFRCNQTGKRLRRGQVGTYRRTRAGANRPKVQKAPKPQPVSSGRSYGYRPNINSGRGFFSSTFTSPLSQSLLRARIDGDGDAMCPYCRRYNYGVAPGERRCSNFSCRERFIAFR
jgi:hypothetical protein